MVLVKTTGLAATLEMALIVIALRGSSEIRVKVTFRNPFSIKEV